MFVHPLVARTALEHARTAGTLGSTLSDTAAALTLELSPDDQGEDGRARADELVAHLLAIWNHVRDHAGADLLTCEQIARCAERVSWAVPHLTATADLARATELGAALLTHCQDRLGAHHPCTLTARHHLAHACQSAGRLTEAAGIRP